MRPGFFSWVGLWLFNHLSIIVVASVETNTFRLDYLVGALPASITMALFNFVVALVHTGVAWSFKLKNPVISGLISLLIGVTLLSILIMIPASQVGNPFIPPPDPLRLVLSMAIILGWAGYGISVAQLRNTMN